MLTIPTLGRQKQENQRLKVMTYLDKCGLDDTLPQCFKIK